MEPIISRETIRDLARAAANSGQNVNVANPYPPLSDAAIHWERDYWAAVREIEAEALV